MAPGRESPLRDDRGSAPVWPLVVGAVLAGAVLGATLAIRAHGRASRVPWVFLGGLLGVAGILWLGLLALPVTCLADRVAAARRRRLDASMGPLLRNWLGLEIGAELHDEEFRWWRRCVRRGITAREVQRWSDRGMPYPLLVAAPGTDLQLGPVLALANVMRSAGAWDGLDRRALTDLIGYHVEIMAGSAYPVLDRWLTLPLPQVRDQVATAVSRADLDLPYARVEARASLAAERVLYDLEAENGLKGYRRRSPKVIDPSWIAASAV